MKKILLILLACLLFVSCDKQIDERQVDVVWNISVEEAPLIDRNTASAIGLFTGGIGAAIVGNQGAKIVNDLDIPVLKSKKLKVNATLLTPDSVDVQSPCRHFEFNISGDSKWKTGDKITKKVWAKVYKNKYGREFLKLDYFQPDESVFEHIDGE